MEAAWADLCRSRSLPVAVAVGREGEKRRGGGEGVRFEFVLRKEKGGVKRRRRTFGRVRKGVEWGRLHTGGSSRPLSSVWECEGTRPSPCSIGGWRSGSI